ncbi:hypothetical protein BN439_1771 [Erwinia amylovora Ea644]|nr:hypothetical protein BN439_1771 [Erwinia amylovora Ea644]CCP06863.1 hypothetical protein BN440_1836 [Erwinia amylovora MR1]
MNYSAAKAGIVATCKVPEAWMGNEMIHERTLLLLP